MLDAEEFSPQGQWNQVAFRDRVRRYEAATEALANMAGVIGRWGDDSEFPLAFEVIRSLYAQAEKLHAGLTVYLNLRSYPAVLVLTAYGLALTRAGRWSALHRLFDVVIERQDGDSIRAVEVLFLWAWKGGDNEAWRQIEGLEGHKTALSDRQCALFLDWGKRFLGLTPDIELVFERFEVLGSLAHFERNEISEVQQVLVRDSLDFVWMPIGRAGWHESNAKRLLAEIQAEPMKTAILQVGFAKGETAFVDLFVRNFKRISARLRF